MSSNFPPPPPGGPDQGPPLGPPPPPTDYLQSGGPAPEPSPGGPRGRGRRIAAIVGGVAVVALIGGGAWAWNFWFNQGPQPAEALPADTLAYVSIDLDPTGEQQIEAVETLRKFPVIKEELDFDLGARDDIKRWIFEKAQEEGDVCPDLDYEDDLKPWLGDRFAFAIVDRDDEEPAPVLVAQIKDEHKAADGIEALARCGEETADELDVDKAELGGYAFSGDWVVVAETEDIAKDIVADAEDDPLADNDDFEELTEAAGDSGVLTAYAAPEAGRALMDTVGEDILTGITSEFGGGAAGEEFAEQFTQAIEDFPGAAGSLRFDDGAVQFELATGELSDETKDLAMTGGSGAGDVVSGLPDSTVATVALSLPEGWADVLLDQLGPVIEEESGMSLEEALAEIEQESGLSLPEDVETLLGESVAVAVDSSIDAEVFEHEDPSLLPAGIRIKGDPEEIEEVLDKIRTRIGPEAAEFLVSETDGDYVLIGTNEDYVDKLAEGGHLGDDDTFRDVVDRPGDASQIFFVDFDAEDWLVDLFEDADEDEAAENVDKLRAFGVSTWSEGDELHLSVKLTTD